MLIRFCVPIHIATFYFLQAVVAVTEGAEATSNAQEIVPGNGTVHLLPSKPSMRSLFGMTFDMMSQPTIKVLPDPGEVDHLTAAEAEAEDIGFLPAVAAEEATTSSDNQEPVQDPAPVGGILQSFVNNWTVMNTSPAILAVLRDGYALPLSKKPPLTVTPVQFPVRHMDIVSEQVRIMLGKRAIERVVPPYSPGYYSRIFVVPKASGGWRPVIDLSNSTGSFAFPNSKWRQYNPSYRLYKTATGPQISTYPTRIFMCQFIQKHALS